MHARELPGRIALERLARGVHEWQGQADAAPMQRLADMEVTASAVDAYLQVDTTQGRPQISGSCSAEVGLVCERCLGPMRTRVAGEFDLTAVDLIEEAEALDTEVAVVETPRGTLDVVSLLEDELILALPVVARHENADCSRVLKQFGPSDQAGMPPRENPFKMLEVLKSSTRDKTK